MTMLFLTAAAAAWVISAGAASAKPAHHRHTPAHCRDTQHAMHHGKVCPRHMMRGGHGSGGMGNMSGMQGMNGMDHSGMKGDDHMMGGTMGTPSPAPSPKP